MLNSNNNCFEMASCLLSQVTGFLPGRLCQYEARSIGRLLQVCHRIWESAIHIFRIEKLPFRFRGNVRSSDYASNERFFHF
jgi:hypothetical protein